VVDGNAFAPGDVGVERQHHQEQADRQELRRRKADHPGDDQREADADRPWMKAAPATVPARRRKTAAVMPGRDRASGTDARSRPGGRAGSDRVTGDGGDLAHQRAGVPVERPALPEAKRAGG
jgi:hypothetical protein